MNPTIRELDREGPSEVATTIQNAAIAAGGGSERPGEPAGPGTPGNGSSVGALSVGALSVSADADPEEAAAIVAAIADHLGAEARAAEADDDAETTEGGLWTVSVRMDRPPRTSLAAADGPADPWVAAGRMPWTDSATTDTARPVGATDHCDDVGTRRRRRRSTY